MLKRTSKTVKGIVDKMLLPAVVRAVRLSRSFWDSIRQHTSQDAPACRCPSCPLEQELLGRRPQYSTAAEKPQVVLRQLTLMTAYVSIRHKKAHFWDSIGQHTS
jgi:hypothetical protein